MIKKLLVTLLLFSLQGCTWQNFFMQSAPFDRMTVVNYEGKVRHSRGYYRRDSLFKFKNNAYYQIFFNTKKRSLHLLLHKASGYFLYTISSSKAKAIYLGNKYTSYKTIRKKLRKKGFRLLTHPYTKGYKLSHAFKKYQGVKTILISLSDYATLLAQYRHAISHYKYSLIEHSHPRLPNIMVKKLYNHYKSTTKTEQEKKAILQIGYKLGFEKKPTFTRVNTTQKSENCTHPKMAIPQDSTPNIEHKDEIEKKIIEDKQKEEKPEEDTVEVCSDTQENKTLLEETDYHYYLHNASLDTLSTYLDKLSLQGYDKSISQGQLHQLLARQSFLREQNLLEHGTLEALIKAYKQTKNKRYKEKILHLMKEKKMR